MRNAFPERQRKKKKKERSFEEDKYKGFEVLLDVEDDPNYSPPKGIQCVNSSAANRDYMSSAGPFKTYL